HILRDSAISSGEPDVDFSCNQVGDGNEVAQRAVAACLSLGGLDEAVDALDQAVGDVAVEPGENAIAMLLDGARCLLDRFESRPDRPAVPAIEKPGAPVPVRLAIDLLEGEADPIGACGFQMQPRQSGELGAALSCQGGLIAPPEIA